MKAAGVRLSENLPEKVEIIDRAERSSELLPVLEGMVSSGLGVVDKVHIISLQRRAELAGPFPDREVARFEPVGVLPLARGLLALDEVDPLAFGRCNAMALLLGQAQLRVAARGHHRLPTEGDHEAHHSNSLFASSGAHKSE
jgi:hypothetical protein